MRHVGLLTADPALTGDVVKFFHYLAGRAEIPGFERLLVAPRTLGRGYWNGSAARWRLNGLDVLRGSWPR